MDKKYIWQKIQESGYRETEFIQEREFPSLVEEVSGSDFRGRTKVNLRLRFPQLLDITAKNNNSESGDKVVMHDWELDLFLHFYALLDLYSGYNKNNQLLDMTYKDFIIGKYGEKIRELFSRLSLKERNIIVRNFCTPKYDNVDMFYRVYKEMYPSGLIYKKGRDIIVYLDMEECEEVCQCVELLRQLFLPISVSLKIHFKYHMGIIGIEDTMKINKIRIF